MKSAFVIPRLQSSRGPLAIGSNRSATKPTLTRI
jgi:hypothetical protein